jgi:hypothetical protein
LEELQDEQALQLLTRILHRIIAAAVVVVLAAALAEACSGGGGGAMHWHAACN